MLGHKNSIDQYCQSAPIMLLGRKAKIVPTMAKIEQTKIKK